MEGLGAATAELATSTEAEVLFVHVADCNVCCGAQDHPALHAHERDLLEHLVAELTGRCIRSRGEQRVTASGRVAEHMLDAIAEFQADLLIVPAPRPLLCPTSVASDRQAPARSSMSGVGAASSAGRRCATETRVAEVSVQAGVCGRLTAAPGQDQISGDLEALEHEVEAELNWCRYDHPMATPPAMRWQGSLPRSTSSDPSRCRSRAHYRDASWLDV